MDLKNININDLKNIDLESIKSKIKSIDKKILIKFGVGFASVIIFLIIYYSVLRPIVDQKKAKLSDMQTKQSEISNMNNSILTNKAKIKKLTPQYEKYSTLFHSKAEVEGLYESLSQFAGANNLVISRIQKGTPVPVTKASAMAGSKNKKSTQKVDKTVKQNIAYFKIPVEFQIKGNFLGYIKFKRQVAMSQKMLNFDKETIKVIKGDTTSAVVVNGTLTIVGLPDDFF
ncbi:pilus assembly protein PilO [Candidatus Pelagibacter sp.]|uniref:pilus assembly protein PilO n=1 Tax=Candidatus Pelagibacter sp. TaxID=2024849 RepID=UPI003F86D6F5